MTDSLVDVADLHKHYRDTVAVSGVSFHLQAGEILGLLGPNGAGKTTILRAIAGIITPTAGALRVAGANVASDPVRAKQRLAYVPDDPQLFDALTVWEHLEFIAAAYGVTDFAPEAEKLMAEFELTARRDTLASELSRGMKQKTAICCAYLHSPRVILLDEPMTGLDPRGIRTLKSSIARLAAGGAAFVVSSHLLALIQDLCTSLLIVHHGQRLYFGPAAQAREAFDGMHADATLEDVFFRATGDDAPAANTPDNAS